MSELTTTLTQKRDNLIAYLGRELQKYPTISKAFKDLQLLDTAIEKAAAADLEKANEGVETTENEQILAKALNCSPYTVASVLKSSSLTLSKAEEEVEEVEKVDETEEPEGKSLEEALKAALEEGVELTDEYIAKVAADFGVEESEVEDKIADILSEE